MLTEKYDLSFTPEPNCAVSMTWNSSTWQVYSIRKILWWPKLPSLIHSETILTHKAVKCSSCAELYRTFRRCNCLSFVAFMV